MQRLEPLVDDIHDLHVPQARSRRAARSIDPPPADMPSGGDPIDFSQGRSGRDAGPTIDPDEPRSTIRTRTVPRCDRRRRRSERVGAVEQTRGTPRRRRSAAARSRHERRAPVDYSRHATPTSTHDQGRSTCRSIAVAVAAHAVAAGHPRRPRAREADAPLHGRRGPRRLAALRSVEPRRDRHADSVQSRLPRRRRVLHRACTSTTSSTST